MGKGRPPPFDSIAPPPENEMESSHQRECLVSRHSRFATFSLISPPGLRPSAAGVGDDGDVATMAAMAMVNNTTKLIIYFATIAVPILVC